MWHVACADFIHMYGVTKKDLRMYVSIHIIHVIVQVHTKLLLFYKLCICTSIRIICRDQSINEISIGIRPTLQIPLLN